MDASCRWSYLSCSTQLEATSSFSGRPARAATTVSQWHFAPSSLSTATTSAHCGCRKPSFWRVELTARREPRNKSNLLFIRESGVRKRAVSLVARTIRNAIRPYFYSVSGRFARITRISDSRESPDSRESCESIRANHATKAVSKRVVLADVPPERKPERGYVRQNHPFGNRPFISQWPFLVLTKGRFPKGWFRRMFSRNENRNEGTFAKTTLLRNRPFISQWENLLGGHFLHSLPRTEAHTLRLLIIQKASAAPNWVAQPKIQGQGHPFPEMTRGFRCLVCAVVIFLGRFPWKEEQGKNLPKNPRFSRDLFDQNPLREISALIQGVWLD